MQTSEEDFFSQYLSYAGETEVPAFFSRWAAIAGIGAYLGRQYFIQHGNFNIYSNIYCMLIGSPGTRKGTAIKTMKYILSQAGYERFAAERTSKEKFLLDLAGEGEITTKSIEDLMNSKLFGDDSAKQDCEMFIAIDEFNDFIGNGNIEFISMLGNMWDYHGNYTNRIKTGKSVQIWNPTISIIGGNTPTGFALAFPPEIFGQGFFSRLLLIYGEPNGRRIAFPKNMANGDTEQLVQRLKRIREKAAGQSQVSRGAEKLLERIYENTGNVFDIRFESYYNRRFTHLLKLCLIVSAARYARDISERDVVVANTLLTFAERLMPKALGEFGKSKHSDVSHKIMQLIESSNDVVSFKAIWAAVHSDLEKMSDLAVLLQNLAAANKIQSVPKGLGFLPIRALIQQQDESTVDFSILTDEERRMTV